MSDSPLLQSIALIAASIATATMRRTLATLAGYIAAGGLLTASLFFLTLSGYRATAASLGDVAAGGIVGGVYLVLALLILLLQQRAQR